MIQWTIDLIKPCVNVPRLLDMLLHFLPYFHDHVCLIDEDLHMNSLLINSIIDKEKREKRYAIVNKHYFTNGLFSLPFRCEVVI